MNRVPHPLSLAMALAVACTAASATTIKEPGLRLVAQGDSIRAVVGFHVQGAADSVVVTYTNAKSITQRHSLPGSAIKDSAVLVPNPPLAPGDTTTVTVTLQPYRNGKLGLSAITTGLFTRLPSVVVDSLRLSIHDWTGPWNTRVPVVAAAYLHNGQVILTTDTVWTGLKEGTRIVVASIGSLADTVRFNVQARYPNQPAGYVAFAAYNDMKQLPAPQRKPVPGVGNLGAWFNDTSSGHKANLTLQVDSTAGLRVE